MLSSLPAIQLALYGLLSVCLVISLITDLQSRLIYNVVTYPTALLALLMRVGWTLHEGWTFGGPMTPEFAPATGIVGLLVGFVPFLMMGMMRDGEAMGMGDAKLMGAVGAVVGFPGVLWAMLFTSLVGGIQAILVLLWQGQLLQVLLQALKRMAQFLKLREMTEEEEATESPKVPYGVAIVVGTFWSLGWSLWNQAPTAG
mgnify:CR=1 FL=1